MQEAGVAQGSVSRRVSTVKSFYRWLRLVGEMRDDPLALVSGPKQAKRLPHVLTLDHITTLLDAANATGAGMKPEQVRDRALLEVMYASGLRVSEAHGLDVGDIDLDHRALRVRGKGNKERIVVIGGPAQDALERYLADGRRLLLKRAKPRSTEDGVFINRFGTRLTQRAIQILIRKYALKAGIDERVHPHLLRHSFATHLLDNGAELRVVQELLGHTNPNTTQIYLHVTETRQRTVMDSSQDELAAVEMARRSLRAGVSREK
jgi:site-specific recombinase XerD